MTFEQYLRENSWPNKAAVDHTLRVWPVAADGEVRFYIHPNNVDGDTRNFVVKGDQLLPDPRIIRND